jgi:SAM-dependent methyltransferase
MNSPVGREADGTPAVPDLDTSRPHAARIYDYYLGGKNHFAADRETADKVLEVWPHIRVAAREQRNFLGRAVGYLAAEAGIRQFLDIGAGLPTSMNVHEIAQEAAPSSRVVYVDNDPLVLAHARALLTSSPEGRTSYAHADLRAPEAILSSREVRDVLDLRQPVGLILVGILHLLPDEDKPAEIVAALLEALAPGSYLVASHLTDEHDQGEAGAGASTFRGAGLSGQLRDSGEFARLALGGLELVPPGVTLVSEWRQEGNGGAPHPSPAEVNCYGGVGRKRPA